MDYIKTIAIIIAAAGLSLFAMKMTTAPLVIHDDGTVTQEQPFGAVSSPDLPSPYFSFGGVRNWARSASLKTGTSTICSIATPAATSTLVAATLRVDSGNPYALQYEIGHAANTGATTTSLGKMVIAANTKSQVIATTTHTAVTDGVVGPNTYVNFRVGTSTPGADLLLIGKCSAVFREI